VRLLRDAQRDVDARRHAAAGDAVLAHDDAFFFRPGAERLQKLHRCPVRRGLVAGEQTRGAEEQRAGAGGGDPAGAIALQAKKREQVFVEHRVVYARPAGDEEHVADREVGEDRVRQDRQSAFALDRVGRRGHEMHGRARQAMEHLVRAGEVELREIRKEDARELHDGHLIAQNVTSWRYK
jgi:hypothetical protein